MSNLERQKEWEREQKLKDTEHERDSLATQNTILRKRIDEVTRSSYENQEEVITLRNEGAAKDAKIEDLESALRSRDNKFAELQGNSNATQAQHIALQRELFTSRESYLALNSSYISTLQHANQLSAENSALLDQIIKLDKVSAERDGLYEQNRSLTRAVKLLRSQVGNYMVGTGRVGVSYYILQLIGNIPGLGSFFRQASEEVYNKHQKFNK